MNNRSRIVLYALVGVAACARLLLQVAALPPYAGLDEVWHVSRLAFVHAEGRNPDIRENSVPRYVASATANDPAFPADFGHIGARWPEVVRARRARGSRRRGQAVHSAEHRGAAASVVLLGCREASAARVVATRRAAFLEAVVGCLRGDHRAGHGAHRRDVLRRARDRGRGAARLAPDVGDAGGARVERRLRLHVAGAGAGVYAPERRRPRRPAPARPPSPGG